MLIDLHTHSRVSDGTQTPTDLVASAAQAQLDVVGLTDHDTTDGWAEATQAASGTGVAVVLGTEVSARTRGISVHLLSYLQDPTHPALVAELERIRTARLTRARRMVELLAEDYDLSWDDVVAQTQPGTTVGRPHIADALVVAGVVPDRSAAFARLLVVRSRYYVPHYAPDVFDAIAAVRAAGGVPVLAHPGAEERGRVVPDDTIEAMAAAGLAGLEVHHRDNPPAQVVRLSALAARLGLLTTGSSDYHGAGKPNRMGENVTDPAVFDAIEAQGVTAVVRS
ncbi:PHP domain-containing protein [Pengzhenrongella frigida]|uniref:PHP domain-containing protein n=1 Tax=Pengzhenrongella frigida TaxID=1259133 RepID=A0A4Q5N4I2_9MICO|nr:PHP domain-containing protein [Cellulomonas sp. HLT2-17]RYV52263.1 PHP domain-containing protein [Cellulomonas sp. HLT2-17]